ncbi:M13 family metallopeptidase [Paramicrobacterium agarici]|uniref:M13 family metallopeptidase n=1 Tax=Paramicrobacterium agarici TaxID=630514 RepID=UPI00114ED318|nr:M13-type metalloendopeptidase [Microbacterium agarici]TQO22522.1 putative endopeptidase [Microbacterium agarici]
MTDGVLNSGIEIDGLSADIRAQDDLFRHVNGTWIDNTEIPGDKARWGTFHQLAETAEKNVQQIILDAQKGVFDDTDAAAEARKVGDLYASFMNTERIAELGVEPVAEQLRAASAVSSIAELLETIGTLENDGLGGFVGMGVDNDPGNPERYVMFMVQGGITLPDESYYRDEKFAEIRSAYLEHLQRMFELGGLDDAAARAQRVFDLETELAAQHWDNVATRDAQKTYNLYSGEDALGLIKGVDMSPWTNALDMPDDALAEIVVMQPSYLEGLGPLLVDEKLDAWKDWLAWKVLHDAAPYLTDDFVSENFDFYGRTITGTPEQRERWKRGVSLVEGAMGEAVGRVYIERHFPPEAKTAMDELVANLIEAYRQSISTLDWMSPETRERALDKLAKFTPKIGYPVKWRDYTTLEIDPADLIGNVHRANRFELHREVSKIGKPLDRDEWFMTPQTVNAYYNPGFNEIVFPAAILQFPFFDASRDAAANYGAIGAVIGHELGHGFDDQGSRFDGDGRLIDWWTDADREAFEKRTGSLIEQYNALAPQQVPDHHVNGALTIGENIGDLGGLGIAWKAYLISLDGQDSAVIDGLTGAERFFLSWAQAWRQKGRDAETIRLLAIDPHSPNEFRCNQIVRNLNEFYTTFGVQKGDALWLDPEQRVTIW